MRERTKKILSATEKQKKLTKFYGLFAIIIIPIYSYLFASQMPLLKVNLSMLGGMFGKGTGLFLWGVIIAFFFLTFVGFMYKIVGIKDKKLMMILSGGSSCLLMTVIIPYSPEVLPILSEFHNYFAYGSSLLMIVSVYYFVIFLRNVDTVIYKRALIIVNVIIFVSGMLLFTSGVTSLLEILLTISLALLMFLSFLWLQKSKNLDTIKKIGEIDDIKDGIAAQKIKNRQLRRDKIKNCNIKSGENADSQLFLGEVKNLIHSDCSLNNTDCENSDINFDDEKYKNDCENSVNECNIDIDNKDDSDKKSSKIPLNKKNKKTNNN